MITDNLKNADRYYSLHAGFKEAFEFLKNAENTADGSYELVPGLVSVSISAYTNKPVCECRYEAHARMIDIQCVIDGSERIDIVNAENTAGMEITADEYEKSDIAFFNGSENGVSYVYGKNDFAVIYPYEAHRPCIAPDMKNGVSVRKAVVKIKY